MKVTLHSILTRTRMINVGQKEVLSTCGVYILNVMVQHPWLTILSAIVPVLAGVNLILEIGNKMLTRKKLKKELDGSSKNAPGDATGN